MDLMFLCFCLSHSFHLKCFFCFVCLSDPLSPFRINAPPLWSLLCFPSVWWNGFLTLQMPVRKMRKTQTDLSRNLHCVTSWLSGPGQVISMLEAWISSHKVAIEILPPSYACCKEQMKHTAYRCSVDSSTEKTAILRGAVVIPASQARPCTIE